jgi:predicted molibdopterin-dependent oxidoreductase YjgC
MDLLILSDNSDGFIPYYQGGNDQGIFDMGAIHDYLPGYIKPKKKGKKYTEMLNGGVKALYLTEPASVKNIEFLIIQDIYPSKIMNKANVVFPTRAFTEDDGTATSLERRIQKIKQAVKGPDSTKSDWKIVCDLAKKMGAKGFDYKNCQQVFKEIKETVPFISGMGIWNIKNKQPTLLPLVKWEEMKDLPSAKLRFRYRGADITERVDDFRLQIDVGGK